jgi:hypothetical protein
MSVVRWNGIDSRPGNPVVVHFLGLIYFGLLRVGETGSTMFEIIGVSQPGILYLKAVSSGQRKLKERFE